MENIDLDKILSDTSELDPVWQAHFIEPLITLLQATENRYPVEAPPKSMAEARKFAEMLWECSDQKDLRSLAEAFPVGAGKLMYLLVLVTLELLPRHRETPLGVEPKEGKPFAVLAFRGLEWLDKVEANNPGRTR